MMKIFLVEANLIDHPEYQTFVKAFSTKEKAIKFVACRLQEAIDDLGEEDEEIVTTQFEDGNLRMDLDGGEVYFITKVTVE